MSGRLVARVLAGAVMAAGWWIVMAVWVAPDLRAPTLAVAPLIAGLIALGRNPFSKRPW